MNGILRTFFLLSVSFLLLIPSVFARSAEDEEFDPLHHTMDGHYLDFSPLGKINLPRLIVVRTTEGALALRRTVIEDSHGDAPGTHNETVLIDLSITRHFVFAVLASCIVLVIFLTLARRYKRGPGRTTAPQGVFQNLFETLILFIRDDIARPSLGEKRYRDFLPFLLTSFFFILTCNLLGLVPFGATATSNLTITAVLAGTTFVLTQVNGSKEYWMHIFWPPGMPVALKLLLIPTEILGVLAKPIALAIRLFANMTAGHLVILSLLGLAFTFNDIFGKEAGYGVMPVSLAFALFVGVLEILIAFIQAYIFTFLSALFIGMAIAEHEHAHEDSH